MNIWFTSDTHFSSIRTLELSKRPFKTVEEMDETLIKNWNSVVGKDDIVYHLGDFGAYSIVNKLNGKINLIFGNYERKDNLTDETLLNFGFNNVYRGDRVLLSLPDNKLKLNLCHEPSNCIVVGSIFNLFGHIHKTQMVKRFGLNVGIDCHNFFPINLDTVLFYKNAIENHYDDNVFRG